MADLRGGKAVDNASQVISQVSPPSDMSAARAGLAAAVSGPGKCGRIVGTGQTTWPMKHAWRPHPREVLYYGGAWQ